MEKEKLLKDLEERLKGIPPEDREKLIELYEDLIDVAKENRKDNKQMELPTKAYEEDFRIPYETSGYSTRNLGRMILASVSLLLFNSIFILGPAISVAAVYASFGIVAICFIFSPLMVATQVFIGGFNSFELFVSLILCGIGVFLGIGMLYAGRFLLKVFITYCKWNLRLIKGEE